MLSQEIRKNFLEYFKKKQHTVLPSSPVVPHDDPTILFTNAGMNQFKDIFLGKNERELKRATTSQKCIRVGGKHNDLDNVGHTTRHMTFFEMLGNFSFGDYFKKEAMEFAFEVATSVFEFPVEKLFVSVFEEDEEAYELWKPIIGEKKIVKIGAKDNFWAMGDTGPCGPCSELFFDRGSKFGNATSPKDDIDGERFLEFWNLVFMQFSKGSDGKQTLLTNQSIDTGAGLERVVSLKMGVDSIFETDILSHLITKVGTLTNIKYEGDHKPAFHVIADHLRSLSFAIADGAEPGNVERGYVLRKILRRAVRYGRLLGLEKPFLGKLLPSLVETMGDDFIELKTAQNRIEEILTIEEESFLKTLKKGGGILNQIIEKAHLSKKNEISGDDAFKLKDTYGFPLEEILLLAKDSNLTVNLDAYELLEKRAKELSRASKETHSQEVKSDIFDTFSETSSFTGYVEDESSSSIIGLLKDGEFVKKLHAGDEGIIILEKTPFYAEKGGQMGDSGEIFHKSAHFTVSDCKSPKKDLSIHIGKVTSGTFVMGEPITAKIAITKRALIEKNHTATHLLHWALSKVLGPHIRQAGSLVTDSKIRFDFNHHKSLTNDEILEIEHLVNLQIWEATKVKTYELSYADAQKDPHIKQFFGDKYGKTVRVVDINEFSRELCGGTHVTNVSTIGLFRIQKESSIAKGVRRIEALTNKNAEEFMYESEKRILHIADTLDVTAAKLEDKLHLIIEENKQLKAKIKEIEKGKLTSLKKELEKEFKSVNGISVLAKEVDVDSKLLIPFANELFANKENSVLLLALKANGRCQILVKVSQDLIKKNIYANDLIKKVAPFIQGGGGGNKDSAQAGGKNPEGIPDAIKAFEELFTQSN